MSKENMEAAKKAALPIKLLALDVDGVLTDGSIIYTSGQEEQKVFHAKDGLAIAAARKAGLKVAIITGRASWMVRHRAEELGIAYLYENCKEKTIALQDICEKETISLEEIAYMGDDLNDLGALHRVGLPMAPADACEEVLDAALFVASKGGGRGAVREAVEHLLKAKGLWERLLNAYLAEQQASGQ